MDGRTASQQAQAEECRPSAATRALNLIELLEPILLSIPIRDMLLAQRVSHRFQDTIKDSLKIRQALFLEPLPTTTTAELAESRPKSLPADKVNVMPLNPLLLPILQRTDLHRFVDKANENFCCWSLDFFISYSSYRVLLHSNTGASWRNMLVMQPEIPTCTALCRIGGRRFNIDLSSGLTMGRIFEMTQLLYKARPGNYATFDSWNDKNNGSNSGCRSEGNGGDDVKFNFCVGLAYNNMRVKFRLKYLGRAEELCGWDILGTTASSRGFVHEFDECNSG